MNQLFGLLHRGDRSLIVCWKDQRPVPPIWAEIILRMATIPAGQKTCLRAPAGQTKTLLRGKSDFPRSKPPLSSEESQNPRFRAFQAWCKRNTMYLIFVYKSPIYNLGSGPRISTLDLAPGDTMCKKKGRKCLVVRNICRIFAARYAKLTCITI
jgi:hypothetical protein